MLFGWTQCFLLDLGLKATWCSKWFAKGCMRTMRTCLLTLSDLQVFVDAVTWGRKTHDQRLGDIAPDSNITCEALWQTGRLSDVWPHLRPKTHSLDTIQQLPDPLFRRSGYKMSELMKITSLWYNNDHYAPDIILHIQQCSCCISTMAVIVRFSKK